MRKRLCEKYGHLFSADVRRQGGRLFAGGALQSYQAAPGRLEGEISADDYAAVILEVKEGGFDLRCECPRAGAGMGCVHLWCALLAADQHGDLEAAARRSVKKDARVRSYFDESPTPEVPSGTAPANATCAKLNSEDFYVPPGAIASPQSSVPPCQNISTGGGFTTRKPSARGAAGAPGTGLKVLFLIDVTASKIKRGLVVSTWWQSGNKPPKPLKITGFDPDVMMDDYHLLEQLAPYWLDPAAGEDLKKINAGNLFAVSAESTAPLFARLAVSTRLFWRSGFYDKRWVPLRLDADLTPWAFTIRFEVDEKTGTARLFGQLARPGGTLAPELAVFFDPGGVVIHDGTLSFCDYADAFPSLIRLTYANPLVLTLSEADALARHLLRTSRLPLDTLPSPLHYERIPDPKVTGQLFVRTARYTFRGKEQLHADVSFSYNGIVLSEHDDTDILVHADRREYYHRSMGAEEAVKNRLLSLNFRHVTHAATEEPGWKLEPRYLDAVVRELLDEDWLIVAEGKTYRKPVDKAIRVSSGQDWLELKATVDFGNQTIALPDLIALCKRGAASVLLDDGTKGVLPVEWLAQFTALTELGDLTDEALKFKRSQAAIIYALISDRENLEADADFADVREKITTFTGIVPAAEPAGFLGRLREYQAFGLAWLRTMRDIGMGACLADDMGLGKTVQVLAFLQHRKNSGVRKPSVIIMPKSLIFNWLAEAEKFTPGLRVHANTGGSRSRSPRKLRSFDVILTTYGTMRMDIEWLADIAFDCCILDESQAIKNADTSTAKAARLLQADFRLVMSGTPIENHVGELFSQFDFLNPGMLGCSGLASLVKTPGNHEAEDLDKIRQALSPYILRRTKEEVATELPAKTEQVIYCDMTDEQKKLYDELKNYFRAELIKQKTAGNSRKTVDILTALLRLRQLACHPGLINEKYLHLPSGKLDIVLNRLHELVEENHKVLVFSQFTSFLALVRHQLIARTIGYCQLDGSTVDRDARVAEFQTNPGKMVFLISLKAGGVGLNLTAADYVFLLDPWWNPAAEAQAVDRAYRIGQDKKVFAYRFICRETVEEKVLDMQRDKRAAADAVVNPNASIIAEMGADDLLALFN
ncbi:MAG: DEAD/DEAH box helicase [Lentisphaeria bacterium]|nr:DEAD/DEAH box helicase [Lentisphaeria bacterium]